MGYAKICGNKKGQVQGTLKKKEKE